MFDLCKACLMKPNYALNMTHDGIDLFERNGAEWQVLGTVSLESTDMDGDLTALRQLAERRSPKGVLAKLIIPPSQVLYTRIKAPGPTTAQRKRQISHALDGRTPYAVSDLSFDWSGTGDEVMVAVVAKETLQEAEDFARTHGFAALSFVAQPAPDQYAGEPWFGPTAMAAQYLGEGERVERDQDPVRVTGVIALEDPEHDAPEQDEPDAQVDADASPDAHENETQSEPVAAYDAAEFVAPARPVETTDTPTTVAPDSLVETEQPAVAHEVLETEQPELPADVTVDASITELADAVHEPRADLTTSEEPHLVEALEADLPPADAPAPEVFAAEVAPLDPVANELAAQDELQGGSPAPTRHWLDSASMEQPHEAEPDESQLQERPAELAPDTVPQAQETSLTFDATSPKSEAVGDTITTTTMPSAEAEQVCAPSSEPEIEAEIAPENTPASQAPLAQGKPIIARPTFATRRAPVQPLGAGLAEEAPALTANLDLSVEDAADPALALPPEQQLSEAARAAIPRLSSKPARIDLPTSRLTPAAPQASRASRLPKFDTKRAADAMSTTLAKAAASGATLSKAAQSAAQLAVKLTRRSDKAASDAAAPARPSLRREAPPVRARATPAQEGIATVTATPLSTLAPSGPATKGPDHLHESFEALPIPPVPDAAPQEAAEGIALGVSAPQADAMFGSPSTLTTAHSEEARIAPDAALAAQEIPTGNDTAFAQDEAPFAADVETLSEGFTAEANDFQETLPRADEGSRTVFGAPKAAQKGAARSGKAPSKFLMVKLVAILLLFMGGVILWAAYLGEEDATEIARQAPSVPTAEIPDNVSDAAPVATTGQSQAALQALPESAAAIEEATPPEAEREDTTAVEATGPLATEAEGTLGATPAPTTTTPPLAEDRLTSLATPPSAPAQTAAPKPSTDLTQSEPTQAEPTQAEIAPVIPTESGTLTPSGTVIYAGRPAVVPPARPQAVTTAAAEAAAAAAFPNADPALKGQRPKQRPASVSDAAKAAAEAEKEAAAAPSIPQIEVNPSEADPVTAEATPASAPVETETAATANPQTPAEPAAPELSAEERAEIATLLSKRPKIRPASVNTAAARAQAAAKAEAEAAAKAEEEARIAAEEEAKRFADASAQAVETSRRPAAKPRNISAAVEAAVAAAVAAAPREAPAPALVAAAVAPAPAAAPATPAAAPAATYTPSPAPKPTVMNAPKTQERAAAIDELDEPEPTAPTSRGATPATVAKQATEKNALNLGKVNLIGLFGSKSNRRALVRMSNGSFVRVKVGDRLDGGQVTAIGDGQLSYQKGGRNTTLKLLAGG